MPYIDPEIVLEAKKVDLLTYFRAFDPDELVHVSGGEYTTKTHDSLRISNNGLWNWCSQGIGGRTALEYLIRVKGLSFISAVEIIMGRAAEVPPIFTPKTERRPKSLLLPQAVETNNRAINYLVNRGIDEDIIRHCIDTGRLYQGVYQTQSGRIFHQCVFVGFDNQGAKRYAAIRGIGTNYKGEATGSDKRFSFSLPAQNPCRKLHLFESAIDLLSLATLMKRNGTDYQNFNMLSLAGVYAPKATILPLSLTQFLSDHPEIREISLHLDNDPPGRAATKAIMTALQNKMDVVDSAPPGSCKDYNDYLIKKDLHMVMKQSMSPYEIFIDTEIIPMQKNMIKLISGAYTNVLWESFLEAQPDAPRLPAVFPPCEVDHYALATIEKAEGYSVPVVLWKLPESYVAILDHNCPALYHKIEIDIMFYGKHTSCITYVIDESFQLGQPMDQYFTMLINDYDFLGFGVNTLCQAYVESVKSIPGVI